MEKTWKSTVGGILAIVSGVIQVIPGIVIAVIGGILAPFGLAWLSAIGAPLIVLGIIAIVGGIYALRRKIWGLALAGSICALIGFVILGILGILTFGLVFSDQPDIIPFTATMPEIIAIIWSIWHWPFIGFIVGFGIFGILPIIFVIRGKREFK